MRQHEPGDTITLRAPTQTATVKVISVDAGELRIRFERAAERVYRAVELVPTDVPGIYDVPRHRRAA